MKYLARRSAIDRVGACKSVGARDTDYAAATRTVDADTVIEQVLHRDERNYGPRCTSCGHCNAKQYCWATTPGCPPSPSNLASTAPPSKPASGTASAHSPLNCTLSNRRRLLTPSTSTECWSPATCNHTDDGSAIKAQLWLHNTAPLRVQYRDHGRELVAPDAALLLPSVTAATPRRHSTLASTRIGDRHHSDLRPGPSSQVEQRYGLHCRCPSHR